MVNGLYLVFLLQIYNNRCPVQLMSSFLRDPDIMEHFVCHPQRKLTNCGKRIYDEVTSATWFENAFNNSKATENGVLKPGHLFVALTVFSDGSPIDKQMKHSEHPFLLTILNLMLEGRKKVDAWQLVSLLPDIEVSDLEKLMDTKKSGNDISLSQLKLYHAVTGFLLETFQDPNKFYDIWVHGLGYTKVYFLYGMVVGDMEEHYKICGFCGGNGLYRQHVCQDCSVHTEDADNPDIHILYSYVCYLYRTFYLSLNYVVLVARIILYQ